MEKLSIFGHLMFFFRNGKFHFRTKSGMFCSWFSFCCLLVTRMSWVFRNFVRGSKLGIYNVDIYFLANQKPGMDFFILFRTLTSSVRVPLRARRAQLRGSKQQSPFLTWFAHFSSCSKFKINYTDHFENNKKSILTRGISYKAHHSKYYWVLYSVPLLAVFVIFLFLPNIPPDFRSNNLVCLGLIFFGFLELKGF